MERKEYKKIVDTKEELILVLDSQENIIFKTKESPLSSFLKKVFVEGIEEKELSIYANQLGIGLAELSKILHVKYYYGTDISIPAKEILEKSDIEFEFTNIVELVKSSSNPERVCPVEDKLNSLGNFEERVEFLEERANQKHKGCYVNFDKK